MNIVTTTSVFPHDYPAEWALTRLAGLGYEYLDLAIDYCAINTASPYLTDNWQDWAKNLRELAESLGVWYTHSHGVGNAASRSMETMRGFELCRILGTRYTVIHPVHKRADGSIIDNDDEFVSINTKSYIPLIEVAERNGVILLTENVLWGSSIRPSAISALVSEVNSPYFGWCYDTGHTNARGHSYKELLGLHNAPLSLHIHDNHGAHDEHLLPGDGNIDWKECLDTLITVGYKGEIVLEAHHQSLDAVDEDRDNILTDLLGRAEKMRTYFKKNT